MLQGLTAHYLVNDSYPLQAGDNCLVHAGAGGVGRLLIQLAKRAGATVFATVSTDEKAEIATGLGADHVINYAEANFREAAERELGPKALAAVYDGVGAATFDDGLELLRARGMFVLFGQSSGPVPDFDLSRLNRLGSLFITRPSLGHHIATREEYERRARAMFDLVAAGDLDVLIGARFPLARAADAHRALQGRETVGKVLLEP
jgi:NADPH2:quinone reductase